MKNENFTAFFLIAVLLGGAIAACFAYVPAFADIKSMRMSDFMTGTMSSTFEDRFDKELPHYDFSVRTWNQVDYTLFKEGMPGALIGKDDWLFTAEEFYSGADFTQNVADNIHHIVAMHKNLRKKGIPVLIVPVPAKARIYNDKLGRYHYPAHWQGNYKHFTDSLRDNDIPYVDLLPSFANNKDKAQLFLRTDTHWSPDGARLAAQLTAAEIARKFPYLSYETKNYVTVKGPVEEGEGDLIKFVAGGDYGVPLEPLQTYVLDDTAAADHTTDSLYGTQDYPIALVGTSYSANSLWGFEYFLREATGANIYNSSMEQVGPFISMQFYLSTQGARGTLPKLLVWEIPERYLATPLTSDIFTP